MTEKSIENGKFTISCLFGDRHFVCQCACARGAFWEILGHTRDFQPISDEPVGTPDSSACCFSRGQVGKDVVLRGFCEFFENPDIKFCTCMCGKIHQDVKIKGHIINYGERSCFC